MNRPQFLGCIALATWTLASISRADVQTISITSTQDRPPQITTFSLPATQPAAILITVDTNHPGQPIDGMGGAFNELGQDALAALDEPQRQQVLAALFDPQDGANLCFNRIPIGASDFALSAYSLDDNPGDWELKKFSIDRDEHDLIQYIHAAQKFNPDMRFHASPWSPPGWLKTSGQMTGVNTSLIDTPQVYQTYANYFVKFLQAYAADGINITRLCPQNEPNAAPKYPGCKMPPDQLAKLTKDWVVSAVAASGLKTEVWLGTLNFSDALMRPNFQALQANADLIHSIKGVSFQYTNIHLVEEFHKMYPDVPLQFSESRCAGGNNTAAEAKLDFQDAIAYFRTGADVFTFWNMVLPEPRKSTWGWRQNSLVIVDKKSQKITYTPSYAVAKFLGRHMIPGAIYLPSRIDKGADLIGDLNLGGGGYIQTSLSDGNQLLALKEPDGSIVVYLLNQGPQSTAEFQLPGKTVTEALPADSLCALVIK